MCYGLLVFKTTGVGLWSKTEVDEKAVIAGAKEY